MNSPRNNPLRVWYVAAGYLRAGGVEAYLCHYAAEMKRRGFDPRIIVFEPLPLQSHRFLDTLRATAIPIESLYDSVARLAKAASILTFLPWRVWQRGLRRKSECGMHSVRARDNKPEVKEADENGVTPFSVLLAWWIKRLAVRRLNRMIRREAPDIVHVKGRLVAEAWRAFPPSRTLYHIATYGGRDPSWTGGDAGAFRAFASRCARIIAPGTLVAETFKREFGIERPVDVVFTMAPDEMQESGGRSQGAGEGTQKSVVRSPHAGLAVGESGEGQRGSGGRRFGIFCRLAEEKGIDGILAALAILDRRGVRPIFTFAGEGPCETTIAAWIAAHGMGTVRIARPDSAGEALAEMDVFVHPSRNEAMPVSLVEALMHGKPCIATPVGGVPDLVRDGIEGLFVPVGDAEAVANAMERFWRMSANEFEGYRQRARSRYEACCRPVVVGSVVEALYRGIAEKGPS